MTTSSSSFKDFSSDGYAGAAMSMILGSYYSFVARSKPMMLTGRFRGVEGIALGAALAAGYLHSNRNFKNKSTFEVGHAEFVAASAVMFSSTSALYYKRRAKPLFILMFFTVIPVMSHISDWQKIRDRESRVDRRNVSLQERLRARRKMLVQEGALSDDIDPDASYYASDGRDEFIYDNRSNDNSSDNSSSSNNTSDSIVVDDEEADLVLGHVSARTDLSAALQRGVTTRSMRDDRDGEGVIMREEDHSFWKGVMHHHLTDPDPAVRESYLRAKAELLQREEEDKQQQHDEAENSSSSSSDSGGRKKRRWFFF